MIYHLVRCLNAQSKETVLRVLCWEMELPQTRIPKAFKFISSMTEVEAMEEKKLVVKALQVAGYDSIPTRENLIDCYLDYADCYNGDIDNLRDDIANGDLSIKSMCNALIRSN